MPPASFSNCAIQQMNLRVPHPSRLPRRVGSYDPTPQTFRSSSSPFSLLCPHLCHPDRSGPIFPSRGFCASGRAVEGPWQPPSLIANSWHKDPLRCAVCGEPPFLRSLCGPSADLCVKIHSFPCRLLAILFPQISPHTKYFCPKLSLQPNFLWRPLCPQLSVPSSADP